ncbi:uncharacterized protein LOC109090184 [Cyprinus carpio]|uniref:Uncharacterized protein LOC109090184 n=1 Tax=Cyprinus carpio TaxID=7962 RepID=A0A9Q9W9P7_CYPCA|nr:uncharacterized protein LOC109090184 [Cyprinus carpio]
MVFYQCLAQFCKGNLVLFRTCRRLLGMMALSLSVVLLGLLKMRDFQRWVAARILCPRRHLTRRVRIHADCMMALYQWRDPCSFQTRIPLGGMSLRKVVTTDASLSGWGAVFQGRSLNGRWMPQLCKLNINILELSGSLSGPETFSLILGRVSCSGQDRQHNSGGIYQSPRGNTFVTIAQSNAQSDCLGRGALQLTARDACTRSPECRGGSPVKGQPFIRRTGAPPAGGGSDLGDLWQGCRSLCLAGKCKVTAVFLSQGRKCAFGCGCAGAPVAECVALHIPSAESYFSHPRKSKRKRIISPSDSPSLAGEAVGGRDCPAPSVRALAAPVAPGHAVASGEADFSSTPGTNP